MLAVWSVLFHTANKTTCKPVLKQDLVSFLCTSTKGKFFSSQGRKWMFPIIRKSGSLPLNCQQDCALTYEAKWSMSQRYLNSLCCVGKGSHCFPKLVGEMQLVDFVSVQGRRPRGSHIEGIHGRRIIGANQIIPAKSSEVEDLSHI